MKFFYAVKSFKKKFWKLQLSIKNETCKNSQQMNPTCNIKNRFHGISLFVIFFENHKSPFLPVLIIV